MKIIPLTKGKTTIVSNEDYEKLMKFKWFALACLTTGSFCAARNSRKRKGKKRYTIRMHRIILNLDHRSKKQVDHINHNSLDNRRENLRKVTNIQNSWNRKMKKTNTSGYYGVCWHKRIKKWGVSCAVNGKQYHFGYFDVKEEAAKAYNAAVKKLHGVFAQLNILNK
jgi:hypothetical protein